MPYGANELPERKLAEIRRLCDLRRINPADRDSILSMFPSHVLRKLTAGDIADMVLGVVTNGGRTPDPRVPDAE